MKKIFLFLLFIPIALVAHTIAERFLITQEIDGHYFELSSTQLYSPLMFKKVALASTDTFSKRLDSIIFSSGNPIEHIAMHWIDAQHGFIYGNEIGYAIYPFLFRTSDGGQHWERSIFEARHIGAELLQDQFYMFNKKQGILLYNGDLNYVFRKGKAQPFFQYYLTQDGGESWTKHKKKVSKKNIDIVNSEHHLLSTYSAQGEVTTYITQPIWGRPFRLDTLLILHSTDYGHHFEDLGLR